MNNLPFRVLFDICTGKQITSQKLLRKRKIDIVYIQNQTGS